MADFSKALERTIKNEGGYVLHTTKGDTGGLTYAGISRGWHPGWPIWDILKSGTEEEKRASVATFYKEAFWDILRGDDIASQGIAEVIFDTAVNIGLGRAVKMAQEICQHELPGRWESKIDGKVGDQTVGALNSLSTPFFISQYTTRRLKYYADIVNNNKSQWKFLLGWLNRALSYV